MWKTLLKVGFLIGLLTYAGISISQESYIPSVCGLISCDLTVDGTITVDGTLTADGIDINPDTNNGGCVELKECEGGTGCDTAGAGESAFVCLPDNTNPLTSDKERMVGLVFRGLAAGTNWATLDTDQYCLNVHDSSNTVPKSNCQAADADWPYYATPFYGGVYVGRCTLACADCDFDTATDRVVLRVQEVNMSTWVPADLGNPMVIIDTAADCEELLTTLDASTVDDSYTCVGCDFEDDYGMVVGSKVTVSGFLAAASNGTKTVTGFPLATKITVAENIATEAGTGDENIYHDTCAETASGTVQFTVDGTSSLSSGSLQIQISDETIDGGAADNAYVVVECEYF